MRPILFEKTAADFTTNGLGRLDCVSCIVTEERNGMYELEAEVPQGASLAPDVGMDSVILARPSDGAGLQPFRVYNIGKPINGIFTVRAQHISYQLSHIPSMPFTVTAATDACAKTLAALKSNAVESCPFSFSTDVSTFASYSQPAPASIRSRLGGIEGSVIDQFGGEYEWDGYDVILHKNRGKTVADVTLAYGKNITDLTQEEYISSTVTGVCPYWMKDGEDGTETVTLPEKVVESEYADSYAYRRTAVLDLSSDFETAPTVQQLRNAAATYIGRTGIGVPAVSIKVSFVDLAGTEEYKDVAPLETVKLCDMVNVYFGQLGISTTAKVVKTVYNVLLERYDSVEIGSVRTSLASTITAQDGAITEASNRAAFIVKQASNELQDDINNATDWLTGSGGYVLAVRNDDENGTWKELLFMDTNDSSTAKNVLRINENGIGFSSRGVDGPYTQAWTLDGKLVIGGTNVPSLTVYKSDGTVLLRIDSDGMEWNSLFSSMTKTGVLKASNAEMTGTLTAGGSAGPRIRISGGAILGDYDGTQSAEITMNSSWGGSVSGQGMTINSSIIGLGGQIAVRQSASDGEPYSTAASFQFDTIGGYKDEDGFFKVTAIDHHHCLNGIVID